MSSAQSLDRRSSQRPGRRLPVVPPLIVLAFAALPACFPLGPLGTSPTFTVTTPVDLVDINPGDGVCQSVSGCSLRAAIMESNALPGAQSIQLNHGSFQLTLAEPGGGGITGGDLDVTDSLRIVAGPNLAGAAIDAGGKHRVFEIHADITSLERLVIQNGDAQDGGGVLVHPEAALWILNSTVRDNHSFSVGGGISNYGGVFLRWSIIERNRTEARGGGLRADDEASTLVVGTTFRDNDANVGGGIHSSGNLLLYNSTISGGDAEFGGAGIFSDGTATLNNVTVAFNTSASLDALSRSAGLYNLGQMFVRNSIVYGNTNYVLAAQDCNGGSIDWHYTLVGDTTKCTVPASAQGMIVGSDPLLAALAFNGGFAPTHALAANSPAVNAGSPAPLGSSGLACLTEDQRQLPRNDCDMGAYER